MTIRRAALSDAAAIAHVHVDTWRTTYRGLLRPAFLESLSYEQREGQWRRALAPGAPGVVSVVGEREGPVIGFAAGGPVRDGSAPPDAGELYAVYLLEPYQRHHLGSALVRAVAESLVAEGRRSLVVWVLAQNPSLHFYEALGGHRSDERTVKIAGDELEEIAFGWADLGALVRLLSLHGT